jgi:hypothetical protein
MNGDTTVGVSFAEGGFCQTYLGAPFAGSAACPAVVTPSAAVITAAVKAALTVRSSIATVLRAGAYQATVSAPAPGELTITWRAPAGATHAKGAIVVASGTRTLAKAGKATLKVKLTSAGRALLKRSKSLKLTAVGSFKPQTGKTTTVTRAIKLA